MCFYELARVVKKGRVMGRKLDVSRRSFDKLET